MSLKDFLNQAWNDHATQALQVAGRLEDGIKLIEENDQIPSMIHLVTHIMGEHLGKWDHGVKVLEKLSKHPLFEVGTESSKTLRRSIASLEVAGGKHESLDDLSLSDQIRVLAVAASALSEQKNSTKSQILFRRALDKVQSGIDKGDPSIRALAVTGNNLACALEEKLVRSKEDTELMILAAQTGRKYWEIVGTWLETERAEYRLSKTYLKANDLPKALEHAQTCLEVAQENNAPALELFFGYEALALVEKARGNSIGFAKAVEQARKKFDQLGADDKIWCESSLNKLF